MAALANFYLTTWEEYHTGKLHLLRHASCDLTGLVRSIVSWSFLWPCRRDFDNCCNIRCYGHLRCVHSIFFFDYAIVLEASSLRIGRTIWDTPVLTLLRLEQIPQIASRIPNIAVNELFMWYGAVFLAFNIITRYL